MPNLFPSIVEGSSSSSIDPDVLGGLSQDVGIGGGSSSSFNFDLNASDGNVGAEERYIDNNEEEDLFGDPFNSASSTAAATDSQNKINQQGYVVGNRSMETGTYAAASGAHGEYVGNGMKRSRLKCHHNHVATETTTTNNNGESGKISPVFSNLFTNPNKTTSSRSTIIQGRSSTLARDSSSSFVASCFGLPSPLTNACLGRDSIRDQVDTPSNITKKNFLFIDNNSRGLLSTGKSMYSNAAPIDATTRTHAHNVLPRRDTSRSSSTESTASSSISTPPVSSSSSRSASPSVVSGTIKLDNETLHAQELNGLTHAERERLYEQIHGVRRSDTGADGRKRSTFEHDREHDVEFQNDCLNTMEFELSKMRNRYEYNLAHFLAPSVVKNRDFRLMFLRSENYHPRKAAKRLILHHQYKAILWGMDKVATRITYDDLSEDDKTALHAGSIQILPLKDTAGRTIFLFAPKFDRWITWKNQLRALWYLLMTALEYNPELQIDGLVGIFYFTGFTIEDRKSNSSDIPRNAYLIRDGIPFRVASLHWCLSDPRTAVILNLVRTMAGKDFRLRFRHHIGTHMEVRYALLSFGIPREILPIDENGNLDPSQFQHYVSKLQEKEVQDRMVAEEEGGHVHQQQGNQLLSTPLSASSGKDKDKGTINIRSKNGINPDDDGRRKLVAIATNKDVLFGRGKPYQVHPGNVRLAELIEERQMEYNAANRQRKTDISWEIVEAIVNNGGRFMKKSNEDVTSSSKSKKKPKADTEKLKSTSNKKKRDVVVKNEVVDVDDDMWEQVSFAIAREKVAHGFRTPNRGSTTDGGQTTSAVGAGSCGDDVSSKSSRKKKLKTSTVDLK